MNHTLLSLLFCLFTTIASAQNGHLKFMGIPLDGTINEFSAKLAAKGCRVNAIAKQTPVGVRTFDGVFMGKEALIHIYYTPITKNVYRAKACIRLEDEDAIKLLYEDTKKLLVDKYTGFQKTRSDYGYESWSLAVSRYSNDEEFIWNRCFGEIDLYITKHDNSYPTRYFLHIDYTDQINDDKNENAMQDDL